MTILITGGAGYIGSHMVWTCLEQGEDIVVLDNFVSGFKWAVAPKAKLIVGDLNDGPLVEKIFQEHDIHSIIHFAGSVVVPDSFHTPLDFYGNNTCCTHSLLQMAVKYKVENFIFSSTAAVYAAPKSLDPVDEMAQIMPASPYGMSKLMSETMIGDAARAHGLNYVILRYFNVAGADPKKRTGLATKGASHMLKLACEAAIGKRPYFNVYGDDYNTPDGSPIRDFIHVSDLAGIHYKALNYLRNGGESFIGNAGYGHGHSVLETIEVVKRISGKDFDVRICSRRNGDIPAISANSSLMMQRLDWAPVYNDLDVIVEHALNWEEVLDSKYQN